MRLLLSIVASACAVVAGCQSQVPPSVGKSLEQEKVPRAEAAESIAEAPVAKAPRPRVELAAGEAVLDGIRVDYVAFDSREHRLRVVDQARFPELDYQDAADLLDKRGGIAAINGGFFTEEGRPLGIIVVAGERRGSVNRSSLGSGFFVSRGAEMQLVRRQRVNWQGVDFALQSGPFLVEGGTAVSGLSARRPRPRSVLVTDGQYGWVMIQTSFTTLSDLAVALAGSRIGGVEVREALNLDGGRSCDLAYRGIASRGDQHLRPLFARPVRNFLPLEQR